jgi:hypothetical protein
MHPLGSDLTQLSETELHERISELHGKRMVAGRMGSMDLIRQIDILLFDCNQEVIDRNSKIMQKMDEKREKAGLGKLINVGPKK